MTEDIKTKKKEDALNVLQGMINNSLENVNERLSKIEEKLNNKQSNNEDDDEGSLFDGIL